MTDTSFHFLKFSPLKTPDVRKAKTSDDEYATSSSVASSVTNEIITLSRSVQKKLSSDKTSASSESSPEKRSGENLFLTQRFCEPDSKQRKGGVKMKATSGKKPNITGSDSDNDESSGSDLETTGNKKLQNKQVKKKPANKEKHSKANNRSSSSSSSSSDSDESDSSRSSIDNAKYQSLKERLKANSFKNDVSGSDSDSESSSGSVQGQVGKDKQVENFSQDLFSPVSVKQNRKNSSEVSFKSPKKVLEQQKSEILKAEEERHGNKGKQPYHSESELESDFDDDANEVKENESKALKTNLKTKLMESPQMLGTSPDKMEKSAEAQMRERVAHDLSSSESESGESDMSSVIAKLPENSVIAPQNSSSGSEQDSESDNDDAEKLENIVNTPKSHSPQKGSRQKLKPTETLRQRQSNITDHCSSPIDRLSKNASSVKKSQIRYEAPVGFEADDQTNRFVREKEVQGRQLWLIQTPVDFDITALDNKKIKFDGIQTVCMQDEKEKQYEIVIRPCHDNQGQGFSSVVIDEEGNHKLGDSISGQIQVLDWIPGIPPVKIDIPTPQKHEVPDNLTLRYVPFGAESPKRQEETTLLHGKKTKRKHERGHREGKKKKKKERKEL